MSEHGEPMKKPRVSLGLMRFGPPGSEAYGNRITSQDTFNQCLDYLQSRGYNEGDTARTSLSGLQEAWTKAGKWPQLKGNFAKSLQEQGTDCVPIFYLHAPDRSVLSREPMEAYEELYQEGRFKKLGLSNYAAWEVAEIWNVPGKQGWVRPTVLTRGIEEKSIPCCQKYGIDIRIYNPFAGGVLCGKYQSKEVPDDGGRYSESDPVVGSMYLERYFRHAIFRASKIAKPVADRLGLTLLQIAFRWCVHHSKLRVMDGNDGIVMEISSWAQLEVDLTDLEKGGSDNT